MFDTRNVLTAGNHIQNRCEIYTVIFAVLKQDLTSHVFEISFFLLVHRPFRPTVFSPIPIGTLRIFSPAPSRPSAIGLVRSGFRDLILLFHPPHARPVRPAISLRIFRTPVFVSPLSLEFCIRSLFSVHIRFGAIIRFFLNDPVILRHYGSRYTAAAYYITAYCTRFKFRREIRPGPSEC